MTRKKELRITHGIQASQGRSDAARWDFGAGAGSTESGRPEQFAGMSKWQHVA